MMERIKHEVPEQSAASITIKTFHSFCLQILNSFKHLHPKLHTFTICDRKQQYNIVKEILREMYKIEGTSDDFWEWDEMTKSPFEEIIKESEIKQALSMIDYNKAIGKTLDDFPIGGKDYLLFKNYSTYLETHNLIDFHDMILLCIQLLENYEIIKEKLLKKYKFILIDEYQDLNPSQFRILELLGKENKNITIVGDDDQSIYGFRGADSKIFENFKVTFPEYDECSLQVNYRSTQMIINACQSLIQNNVNRIPKTIIGQLEIGEKVKVYMATSEEDEIQYIIHQIKQLKSENEKYKNIAILCRKRVQILSKVAQYFERNGIPFTMNTNDNSNNQTLITKMEKDIQIVLQVILNYLIFLNDGDLYSFYDIYNTPKRKLGVKVYETLYDLPIKESQTFFEVLKMEAEKKFENIKLPKQAKNILTKFINDLEEVKKYIHNDNFIIKLLELFKIDEYLKKKVPHLDLLPIIEILQSKMNEITNTNKLQELIKILKGKEIIHEIIPKFDITRTTISTIHQAKGLEWKHVFLIRTNEGICPVHISGTKVDIEEERRLMYVGMSRAQKSLTITCTDKNPSRFIDEIGDEYKMIVRRDQGKAESMNSSE